MSKTDFKKSDRELYSGKVGRWDRLNIPAMQFLAINGQGDPNGPGYAAALAVLYPLAYAVKFHVKGEGRDFVVPPLEALWWAEDPSDFVSGKRQNWEWQTMLRMPEDIALGVVRSCKQNVVQKLTRKGQDPSLLEDISLVTFDEGDCLQTLHVGSYADEAPVLADLHDRLMPEMSLKFGGRHHEIYLSDPRRVAPEKLRTILRQPVTSTG